VSGSRVIVANGKNVGSRCRWDVGTVFVIQDSIREGPVGKHQENMTLLL
jgi:hypothetical protein